jgi:hypothetical protein
VKSRSVSVTRVVHAAPAEIFALLADPRRHHEIDGSSTVLDVLDAPPRLYLGATFSMSMRIGARYKVRNTVCDFEESRTIAWHHFARFIWRYDLEDLGGATRVTESFDYDRPWAFIIIALGWPERNRAAMHRTLERLEAVVTTSG